MQAERAHEHTHIPTPQPGVAGRSRNPSTNTHIHTAHPSQKWRGASRAPTPAHKHPNNPARSGGVQQRPEPKHTHPHRTPVPEVARCKRSAHTSTHTAQHPSQQWRGAAETRAQTHTPTPRTQARSGGVQAERAHKHTHSPTPQARVVGRTQTRAQAHTPKPHTPARRGGVQEEHAHQHTHTPTPQPGVAGRSRNPSPNTHTHGAQPCQEWFCASGARTQAQTQPNTPASSGGAQPKPEPKHTHPHHAPQPGVAGCKRRAHTSTDTAQQPSQEWRGTAKTRAPAYTPTTHTQARRRGAQPKLEPKHTHPHRASVPGVAGCKRSARTSTHTAQHPSQEWRGAAETRAQTHTPTPRTPARSGRVQAERTHQRTHTPTPSQEWRGAAETRTQPRPRPKHKRHATVGNPVSIARAPRQPVPCR